MKRTLIGAAFIAMTAVACNTKIETLEVYGELSVSLAGEPVVEVISKAVETLEQTDPEAGNYMVRIYDSADAEMYESVYSAFETQRLALGTYYVTAENCTESEAEEGNGKIVVSVAVLVLVICKFKRGVGVKRIRYAVRTHEH